MEQDRDALLAKCRKLYAMAHHENSNINEAETALRQVRRLMDKHSITEADLKTSEFGQEECFSGIQVPNWFRFMSIAVAEYNDCVCSGSRSRNTRVATFQFKGFKEDVLLANLMMDYLTTTMHRHWGAFEKDASVHGKAARSSFNTGFSLAIQEKLYELIAERKEANRKAASENPGTALIATKMAMVAEEFGKQRVSKRANRVSDGGAQSAGRTAGMNTSLNAQMTTGGRQKLLN